MLKINHIDLIGTTIKIENSSNQSKIGIIGVVIYQTKNILILRTLQNKILKLKNAEILNLKKIK